MRQPGLRAALSLQKEGVLTVSFCFVCIILFHSLRHFLIIYYASLENMKLKICAKRKTVDGEILRQLYKGLLRDFAYKLFKEEFTYFFSHCGLKKTFYWCRFLQR